MAIDLFVGYVALHDPTARNVAGLVLRLLIGLPFFGFGVGLTYLSLGSGSGNSDGAGG